MFPEPGTEFLGFRIMGELGRGAFGRVYLAQQGDLAGRFVALKVADNIAWESQALAQLQHSNIVPIYSYHQAGSLQVVCMPYFGSGTLAQVVQHLGGRATIPSSGRELKSTIIEQAQSTAPLSGSAGRSASELGTRPVAAGSEPAAANPPATGGADGWSRLECLTYVEAVLYLGFQLADGLAHAHARGILHRDLKPANVLLADDGRPMLLDFNLAEDTKLRDTAERAGFGGTLPYMSPEQLEGFQSRSGRLDGRSDVYALGVILFELMTGRHPFRARNGAAPDLISVMLNDRREPVPSVREGNPAVGPGAEAIVLKCLAPDPAHRYQSAAHLREDIDLHLGNRPLRYAPNTSLRERARKWGRRNPRLSSAAAVGSLAVALLLAAGAAVAYGRDRAQGFEARAALADHRTAFRDAQLFLDDRNRSRPRLGEALAQLRGVLARYEVPDDGSADERWAGLSLVRHLPDGDRVALRGDVGEVFYLMAQVAYLRASTAGTPGDRAAEVESAVRWNAAAGRYGGDRIPTAVREQRLALAELAGDVAEADRLQAELRAAAPESARDLYLRGALLAQRGNHRAALPHLLRSTQRDPGNFSAWFVRGTVHLDLGQDDLAAGCFSACVAIRNDYAPAWLNRGLAYSRLRFFPLACEDFDRAVRIDPRLTEAYLQRAQARDALGDLKAAEADLTLALETEAAPVRAYFLRANARRRLGDAAGSRADREAGLQLTPADELSWVGRAETRVADDPTGALVDVEEALRINPFSVFGLQLKAHILGERLDRPDDALVVLNQAVELHPDHVPTRAGRGVQLARLGRRAEALRDARAALLRDTRAPNLYQVGCIYALTSRAEPQDRREARQLLWGALKAGFGLDIVDTDTDLDPLRGDVEFQRLVEKAKGLAASRKD
jgi:serine/threonine protein kinase/predicted Zn-dependent protease